MNIGKLYICVGRWFVFTYWDGKSGVRTLFEIGKG